MDIGASLVADRQPPEATQPGQRALDDPAVPSQALAGVDALARDAHPDMAMPQGGATAGDIVGLIRVEFGGTSAALSAGTLDGRNGIEQLLEDHRLVPVSAGQERGERDAGPVDHNMALRARFAAIRWIRPDELTPLLAGMLAQSREARLQSMRSASPS